MGKKLIAFGLTAAVLAAPPIARASGVFSSESTPGRVIETAYEYEEIAARLGYSALQKGEHAIGIDVLPQWPEPVEEESTDKPVISDMVVIEQSPSAA